MIALTHLIYSLHIAFWHTRIRHTSSLAKAIQEQQQQTCIQSRARYSDQIEGN